MEGLSRVTKLFLKLRVSKLQLKLKLMDFQLASSYLFLAICPVDVGLAQTNPLCIYTILLSLPLTLTHIDNLHNLCLSQNILYPFFI